jgi:hypothetical protein
MGEARQDAYRKPQVERFGTLRELTLVGCTLGGDGVWICSTPLPVTGPPGDGDGEHDRRS